jgi:hypothetical protein
MIDSHTKPGLAPIPARGPQARANILLVRGPGIVPQPACKRHANRTLLLGLQSKMPKHPVHRHSTCAEFRRL